MGSGSVNNFRIGRISDVHRAVGHSVSIRVCEQIGRHCDRQQRMLIHGLIADTGTHHDRGFVSIPDKYIKCGRRAFVTGVGCRYGNGLHSRIGLVHRSAGKCGAFLLQIEPERSLSHRGDRPVFQGIAVRINKGVRRNCKGKQLALIRVLNVGDRMSHKGGLICQNAVEFLELIRVEIGMLNIDAVGFQYPVAAKSIVAGGVCGSCHICAGKIGNFADKIPALILCCHITAQKINPSVFGQIGSHGFPEILMRFIALKRFCCNHIAVAQGQLRAVFVMGGKCDRVCLLSCQCILNQLGKSFGVGVGGIIPDNPHILFGCRGKIIRVFDIRRNDQHMNPCILMSEIESVREIHRRVSVIETVVPVLHIVRFDCLMVHLRGMFVMLPDFVNGFGNCRAVKNDSVFEFP